MCGNMQRLAASGERYTHMDRSTLPELDSELCEFTVSSSRVDSSTSKSSAPSVRVVRCAPRESRGRLTPSSSLVDRRCATLLAWMCLPPTSSCK